jgi:polysaccharide biosynthesis transport protein
MAFNNSMESVSEFQRLSTDISHLWLIFKRRWKPALITSTAIFTVIAILTVLQKPSYEAKGKILLKKGNVTSSLTESGKQISELDSVGSSDPISTEIEIIKSLPLIERVIKEAHIRDDKGKLLKPEPFLERRLSVQKHRGTDVLEITYKSKSAQETATVVNKLMNLYIENSIMGDRAQAELTAQFITQQLPTNQTAVSKAEEALRNFKETNLISDLNSERQSVATAISDLTRQIGDTRTALRRSENRTQSLETQLGLNSKDALAFSTLSQNPGVQDALTELQKAQTQLAIARDQYQPRHPKIVDLEGKVNRLKSVTQTQTTNISSGITNTANPQIQMRGIQQQLADEMVKLTADNASLKTQINSLETEKVQYQKRVLTLPKLEQKQRELERQLDAAQSTYSSLLKKLQEVRIAANQSQGNAKVIEFAAPPEKILLKPIILKLILGLLLGILMGMVVTFWQELRDKTIKTVGEAKDLFGYPLLGIIPALEQESTESAIAHYDLERTVPKLILKDLPFSPISEAFRMLQSNLRFLKSDQALKTIAITSCSPGEGKSTIAANLALTMVQQGFKVLLIDADMRRPMQHQIWELRQSHGLSEVLVSQAKSVEAIQEVAEGLHVLSSGVTPPNPGALLDSNRMSALIQEFSTIYDYVIVDTPPLLFATESRSLGQLADGLVLVVRPGVADANDAAATKELLKKIESKVLGLVLNGVEMQKEPDSYFHYSSEYTSPSTIMHSTLPTRLSKHFKEVF